MNSLSRLVVVGALAVFPTTLFAHGGGLDRNGCHTNRKTGDYHCHGGASPAPAPQPSSTRSAAAPRSGAMTLLNESASSEGDARTLTKAAQTLLTALGYSPTVYGVLDARTRSAIESFQSLEGLEKDGKVSALLVLRLAQAVGEKCK